MVQSFCHCFSNEEELAQGVATDHSYLAFAVLKGNFGAVEFSFRTGFVDRETEPGFTKFYQVSEEYEADQKTPRKVRIHSKNPLLDNNQEPSEKPFLRDTDPYYSYTVDLDLKKIRCLHDHPHDYYKMINSNELFEEMKLIYAHIFKIDPIEVEGNNFTILVD